MKKRETGSTKYKLIEAIAAPLGFFVLALLIVESFIGAVLIGANLQPQDKIIGIWIGVGLFVFVTAAVFILVWFKPENLTFDKEAHLIDRGKTTFGTNTKPITNRDKLLPTESTQKGSV